MLGSLSPLPALTVGGQGLWDLPPEQVVPEAYIPSSDLDQQRALSFGKPLVSLQCLVLEQGLLLVVEVVSAWILSRRQGPIYPFPPN